MDSAEEEPQQHNPEHYYQLSQHSGNQTPKIEPVEDACYLLPVGATLENLEQEQAQALLWPISKLWHRIQPLKCPKLKTAGGFECYQIVTQ